MAKKGKKHAKINQRIRKYFDGDGFDVGIERVDTATLSELFAALGIYDIQPTKSLMVRTLRMIFSEAQTPMRKDILHFFENNGVIYKADKLPKNRIFDRESKIEALMEELQPTPEEAVRLREAFLDVRSKKITIEKMESKLRYIRFEIKKEKLEKELEGEFDNDERFEFNASLLYEIYAHTFHKIHTLTTKPYDFRFLEEEDFEVILKRIGEDKLATTKAKQQQIEHFLSSLKDPHQYLTKEQIVNSLRAAPPKSALSYPLISPKVLRAILAKKIDALRIELHSEEAVFVVEQHFTLPLSEHTVSYEMELFVPLEGLLEKIWKSEGFSLKHHLKELQKEYESRFLEELETLMAECAHHAQLLHYTKEQLHAQVYRFLLELLGRGLHITPKIHRKVVRRFLHSIQEELVKKQRQELLARTIRDFKNLFPVARQMRRKLTLHIGPTNSGKTYAAMQKLQDADTGYYLAPLRLLALEGYENLKSHGIESSLITGEEQIIDEEATHISSTIEMLNFDVDVDVCVIDEVQMIDDRDRGWAWANAIIGAPAQEIIMTGSANVKEAIIALAKYLGEELEIVEFERKNPLELIEHPLDFDQIEPATAVVAFSRKDVLKLKQRLSRDFRVSVVYGNLSPEVRREEARRFREGESEILVATDAIAMGMNLPIKTILFAKAQKFDGLIQRDLFSSEVLQIAGRAGRFGLEERGFVGALDKESLRVIKRRFYQEPKPIRTPFQVMANLEHIKLVATILEENSLEHILEFFIENMEFSGPFYAASLDDMLEAAKIVDSYNLDIATKYHLACAPLTLKSPHIISAYERYITALERKEAVRYHLPKLSSSYAQTSQELLMAEDMVKEISLYLWLSYRFGEYFTDSDKAREARGILNRYIENTLQKTQLQQSCRLCGAPLPHNTKYSICQRCFRKNYVRKGLRRR